MNDGYLSYLDFILSTLSNGLKSPQNSFQDVQITREFAIDSGFQVTEKEYDALILQLRDDGYIIVTNSHSGQEIKGIEIFDSYRLKITIPGLSFIQSGGYEGKHKRDLDLKIKSEDREKISDQISRYDLFVKKWTYKSRYVPYILSAAAFIVSVLTYCHTMTKDNKQEKVPSTELKQALPKNDSGNKTDSPLKIDTTKPHV